jgi:hypothetical protein
MMSLGSEYPSLRLLLAPDHTEPLSLQEAFIGCRMLQIFDGACRPIKFYFLSDKFTLLLHVALLRRTSPNLRIRIFSEGHKLPLGASPVYDTIITDTSIERLPDGDMGMDMESLHVVIAEPPKYDQAMKLFNPKLSFWFLMIDYAYLKQTPVAANFRTHGYQMCENAEGCGEVFRL